LSHRSKEFIYGNHLPPAVKIHQFRLPTQFPVGMVNVYLIGDPLTLIDTGPKTQDARNVLEESLRSVGYELGDIQRIVLTHAHIDHFGLASEIRAESSTDIYAPKGDKPSIEEFRDLMEKSEPSIVKRVQRFGFPEKIAKRIAQYHKLIMSSAEEVDVDFDLEEGSSLRFNDGTLKVIDTPAHTNGSISLFEEGNRLFAGDAVLEDYTGEGVFTITEPSPGVSSQLDGLQRLAKLKTKILYPGHGEPTTKDSKRIITSRIESIQNMLTEIPELLNDWTTPVDISMRIFGDLKLMYVPYAINEVMTAASHLLAMGQIMMKEENALLFRAVGR